MGVKDAGKVAMEMAGVKHGDINFLELYDDYIIVVYLQIEDLGFAPKAISVISSGPTSRSKDNCRFKPAAA